MTGRWSDSSAFRADPSATPASQPSRRQTIALLAVLVLVSTAVAVASYLVRPERARAFDLFHGSLFLGAEQSPVAVDLASGKPTLRLVGADKQVGITGAQTLGVVPLEGRTLLLNESTGEFNMVDSSGFVVKHDGGGVPLPKASGDTRAIGVAAGQLAYVVRTSAGRSDVYLVSQSTVESALFATKAVKPRASTVLQNALADTSPGGAVSADGGLWVLVATPGSTDRHTIRQLTVPADSSAGSVLDSSDHGTVEGAAAIGTATVGGGTGTAVAVAGADHLTLYGASGDGRRLDFPAEAGVDEILPATSAEGRLPFLLHGSDGWSVVSVGTDGSALRFPHPLRGVPAGAKLVQPAYSDGALYTMDQTTGRIYRVDMDGNNKPVPGAADYPFATIGSKIVETQSVPDGYAIARGSRVIFNSPTHAYALILFTDGSRPPQRIEKSLAVSVNAAGGAEELTKSTVNVEQPGKNPTTGGNKPKPTNVQPVNNKIDCKTATQKPHIPSITQVQTGSRSVTLGWSYPILDNQDCYPSTYVVSVRLLSNDAPQPPSSVRVQSQVGATVTGLFPQTRYELTVTAYINGQGTASVPIQIRTGPEGPAAPTDLTVSADSSGNWILDWNSCGSVKQGCVAAQSWTVTPSFCDSRGVSAPPAAITTTADPTARQQPTVRYPGSDSLLGRGLQFVVTGSGTSQVPGTPSARSACVYSWTPPNPAAMQLTASQPANTALGGATTTNVTLDLGADPVRNVGGLGAKVTFTLSGDGGSQSKSSVWDGRSSTVSAEFGGVQAGATYTASATVQPAHGGSAVSMPSVSVTTRADWPDISLDPSCPKTGNGLTCELFVKINGITSDQARGEHFDFDGTLQCGSVGHSFSQSNFDPATTIDAGEISQLNQFFGDCSVSGTLRENAGSPQPEVFGGTSKDVPAAPLQLGAPVTAGVSHDDFQVSWGSTRSNGDVEVKIHYSGGQNLDQLTRNWSETVTGPDGSTDCGNPDGNDVPDTVVPAAARCIADFAGSGGSWGVDISFTNKTDGSRGGPFHYSLPNPIPGYQYCTPTGFQAAWGATKADGVKVDSNGGDLSGCGGWSYTLQAPSGDCGTASGAPPATIALTCADDPTQGTWTVVVSWTDSAGRPQSSDPVTVTGSPPTS